MATQYNKTKKKEITKKERWITIHRAYYDYPSKKARDSYGGSQPIPWIQLKGKWLVQAGFDINTPVKVRSWRGVWY